MFDKASQRLKKRIEKEINKAKELIDADNSKLLDDPSELDAHLHLIESYSKLQAAIKPPYQEKLLVTLIILGALAITLTLFWVKKSEIHILLQIQSLGIRTQLAEPWTYNKDFDLKQSIPEREIILANESNTVRLTIPRCGKLNEPFTLSKPLLTIVCDTIQITELKLNKDTQIEIELNKSDVSIWLKRGQVKGTIEFKGIAYIYEDYQKTKLACAVGPSKFPSMPETISFHFENVGSVPSGIKTDRNMFPRLTDLKINALHFSQEQPLSVGYDSFQSTITKGTISVSEGNKEYTLREKEQVVVKGLQGKWTSISIADEIGVRFEGAAKEVKVGPEGFENNLAPSMLEYLYREQTLTLLWGSVGFLCVLIFRFRKVFFQ